MAVNGEGEDVEEEDGDGHANEGWHDRKDELEGNAANTSKAPEETAEHKDATKTAHRCSHHRAGGRGKENSPPPGRPNHCRRGHRHRHHSSHQL